VIFSGGLRVDGEVRGDVRAAEGESGTLVVSEQARIEGEIHVAHLVVNGTVVGPVHATELLELQPRSRVSGDVHYTSLEMHLGAIVEGRLVHIRAGADAKPVELKLAKSN
jgi:cytoskeletal protein CcmA (bactofilin family)